VVGWSGGEGNRKKKEGFGRRAGMREKEGGIKRERGGSEGEKQRKG